MADSGDIVRRITISATGENIDSTTESVNALGNSVTSLTDAQSAWNDTLSSFGSSFGGLASVVTGGGVIAGLAGLLDSIVTINKNLADMGTTANQVGLTLKDFQGISFAGQTSGLSTDQINAGLQQSATLLNDASRNSNSLSKELAANGLSVKNTNGDLISQNQLLTIAGGLIANAKSPGDASAIATMLGYTKEWIPLLEQVGTQGFSSIGDAASTAGVIIDDATVQRATEFDTQWRASSVAWSSYMKAAIADVLPVVDDFINRASKFFASFNKADIEKAANDQLTALADPLSLPNEAAVKITIPDTVIQNWDSLKTSVNAAYNSLTELASDSKIQGMFDTWKSMIPELAGALVTGPAKNVANVQFVDPNSIPGHAASQITEPSYPTAAQMDAAFDKANPPNPGSASHPLYGLTAQDYQDSADGFSKVASKANDANDAVDRAINALTRHTGQTQADADAVGLGAGALATFKAQAAETTAVQSNGGKETAEQAAQFAALKVQAGSAADALAKAQVASTISRGSQTAFLSPADVQIANQLKGIYGDNIPAALASSEAAALRFNNTLSSINTTIRGAATTGVDDFVAGLVKGEGVMQSLKDAATDIGKALTNAGLNSLVTTGLNALAPTASQTAGATSSAAILTTAGTALAASMVAGATSAAAILAGGGATAGTAVGSGGTVAGTAVSVGGAAAGTTVGAGGVVAGAAVTAGGVAAGAALWGPIAALAAVAAGVGLSLFGGSSSADAAKDAANKAQQDQVTQMNADAISRQQQDQVDQANASISDPNSLNGQLQAFDLQAQQQRIAEVNKGAGAIVELEQSLAAQREAIVQKSNEAIEKTMNDFLNSVKTGSQSILSPQDQLAYEQNLFNTQLAGAQGGNSDDLNALTATASALLTLAQNFYASGTGYADTYNQVTSAISSIATGNFQSGAYADPNANTYTADNSMTTIDVNGNIEAATVGGMAMGGIVGNGVYNKDSVVARYAGGGSIALAGGEAVTRATSVNANTIGMLNHINQTGKTPSNDNSDVIRVLTQGFNGQTQVLSDRLDRLAASVQSLNDTTRITNNKRRTPGTKAA